MMYKDFLLTEPVLTKACREISGDDKFIEFLCAADRSKVEEFSGIELSETPVWFLFEEIGWPEGCRYAYDAIRQAHYDYVTGMLRRNSGEAISDRLELRRRKWGKPGKREFIAAHQLLLELLGSFT